MIFDILQALKSRRSYITSLQGEVERLQSMKSTSPNVADARFQNGSFILRVTLQPSERKVVFFVGQKLQTPMGPGNVSLIIPETRSLQIDLPVYSFNFITQRCVLLSFLWY
jgi:hypothetical protein